jgi:hypothetical protein
MMMRYPRTRAARLPKQLAAERAEIHAHHEAEFERAATDLGPSVTFDLCALDPVSRNEHGAGWRWGAEGGGKRDMERSKARADKMNRRLLDHSEVVALLEAYGWKKA